MNIIPDLVLTALLMAPFLVLVAGMHFILYKPMLAYLDARANATVGARKEAEELQARAASRLNEWEVALEACLRRSPIDVPTAPCALTFAAPPAVRDTPPRDSCLSPQAKA